MHSTASDGTCTPSELLQMASGLGLSAIAITDHDTL
jgi:predicted metal-dependent phosphoesterase TrpH